ncbi:PepSY domain-containing protein [Afifella marina]|uniref:Peptidase propeptide and YPEB domain-containing protein n=1 Tax=Afifella marina DSM 2698 TaxID=1120955 RepID=A0A1G5MHN2_AFIMA|nr:hypothetical protein [Afifella marina]SCZ24334.1 hypothetical protein SAMN03080610_00669 [Afifella marina DSM 2698]
MMMLRRFLSLSVLLLSLLVAGEAAAACLGPGEARQVVASGQAVPLSQALRRAGISGEVVDVKLCEAGGGYVYQASVLGPDGRLQRVNIPAR